MVVGCGCAGAVGLGVAIGSSTGGLDVDVVVGMDVSIGVDVGVDVDVGVFFTAAGV